MKKILLPLSLIIGFTLATLTAGSTVQAISAQENKQVIVLADKFEPRNLTVSEGDTVTWINQEGVHAIRSDTDAFISRNLKPGEKFSYQFNKAGKYPYHCAIHGSKGGGGMSGTITVEKKK
ncbi:MAG: plastocyanin/azurin family copper-binding protein [Blastocatellales bacterium]